MSGFTDSAGILEVLNASKSKGSATIFTLVPCDDASPPVPRESSSVDDMLQKVTTHLKSRNADAKVAARVLLPAGFGDGSVVGKDAVLILCDMATASSEEDEMSRNVKATLISEVCARPRRASRTPPPWFAARRHASHAPPQSRRLTRRRCL